MSQITPTGYVASYLDFTRKFGKSVMQTLAEIASNYEYGVNENRHFYFRPNADTMTEKFWIGRGNLKTFEPEEIEAKYNAYKVLCGELTSGDNYIVEVKDVPAGEYEKWGILELPESIPPFGSNLAAGLPADQLLSDPEGEDLENIVDGNTATYWDSNEYQQEGHFLQVDLGSIVSHIGKVVVDSTGIADPSTHFADGFRILISDTIDGNDMISPTEVFAAIEKFGSNRVEITFPATSGRYVRVEITDAKPYFWRVDELEVYAWDISDITRWANYQLLINRESIKKGKLELSKIDRKILPHGKIRVTTESGSAHYDYPIISTKYHCNAKSGLQVSLELGETTRSIADELLTMKRQMTERRLMGAAKGRGLSSGIYTSPSSDQKVKVGAIEAGMLKIYDLADIRNLLTVAEGKILIGEDVLGADLHGIKIIDEQPAPGPYSRVEIGHLAPGVENYGLTVRDPSGNVTVELGRLRRAILAVQRSELTGISTTSNVYTDMTYMSASLGFALPGQLFVIAHLVLYRNDNGIVFVTFNVDGVDKDASLVGESAGAAYQSVTIVGLYDVAAGLHTVKARWKVDASTGNALSKNMALIRLYT